MSGWLTTVENALVELKRPGASPIAVSETLSLRPLPSIPATADVTLLTDWRNAHPEAFFSWFRATEERTEDWLGRIYGPDSRDLMVMLQTSTGGAFGHLALSGFHAEDRSCELGRVLRGTSSGTRGGMTLGIRALIGWAAQRLDVARVDLEVFAENDAAIACYERCGFRPTGRWPLRRVEEESLVRWVRDDVLEDASYFALQMSVAL